MDDQPGSDTSSYVANVTPLIKEPAIQSALTNKLTSEIVTKIDVKARTDQAPGGWAATVAGAQMHRRGRQPVILRAGHLPGLRA
jgi:hypothetical protein